MTTTSLPAIWIAPKAYEAVEATVRLPGSKSVTNRALVLSALADAPSTLDGALFARDTRLMMQAMRDLGVEVTEIDAGDSETTADVLGPDSHTVRVAPGPLRGPTTVDCGLAGTVMRFVPPAAALATGEVAFDGDEQMYARPAGTLLGALRDLGVAIDPGDTLPFTVHGSGSVPGGVVSIDASDSSQFISALLLAGSRFDAGLDVRHTGKPIPSQPHIDMTIEMLRARGVHVDDTEPGRWVVHPGPIRAVDTVIEPDLSNAAPFLAAATVTRGTVRIPGWPLASSQPGMALPAILERFGAETWLERDTLVVQGTETLEGVDIDLHDVGELTPVIAAVAALAHSPSYLRGIAHLRGHETDRLMALNTELGLLGTDVEETDDGLTINPRRMVGGFFTTYDDHRMAQAACVLGLVVDDIAVENVRTTSKTFEGFPQLWREIIG